MPVPLAQLDVSNRVLKRAQYEAFEFSLDANAGGILVRNTSHADPANHEYRATVQDDLPIGCECPADANYEGACKHRVAVAIRRPLLDAVRTTQVATDGGTTPRTQTQNVNTSDTAAEPDDCDCADLRGDFPCWECYRAGRRDLPEE